VQFTQTDPAPLGAGSVFESSYVYGLNSPLVYTDPSGLRGQLAGCAWKNNPIASQQPQLLALRSQILIPVPGTLPPRTVPPRTVPPRSPTTRVPATTQPSTTTTVVEEQTTTTVRPSTTVRPTTTTRVGKCEAARDACEVEADFGRALERGRVPITVIRVPERFSWSKRCYAICMQDVNRTYNKAYQQCGRASICAILAEVYRVLSAHSITHTWLTRPVITHSPLRVLSARVRSSGRLTLTITARCTLYKCVFR
jgi:hypothetical protein